MRQKRHSSQHKACYQAHYHCEQPEPNFTGALGNDVGHTSGFSYRRDKVAGIFVPQFPLISARGLLLRSVDNKVPASNKKQVQKVGSQATVS